jgi:hypothetical protein
MDDGMAMVRLDLNWGGKVAQKGEASKNPDQGSRIHHAHELK